MSTDSAQVHLTDSLMALRGQYELLLTEYASKAVHAREQLNHINALLVDQLVPDSASLSLLESFEQLAALPAGIDSMLPDDTSAVTQSAPKPARSPSAKTRKARKTTAKRTDEPSPKPMVGARIKLPLLEPYKGLSKIDAVEQVMQRRQGEVLHINDIMAELFGPLDETEAKAEKLRMKDTMTRGVRRNLWRKVQGVPLSYRLNGSPGKTAAPAKAKSAPSTKSKSKTKTKKVSGTSEPTTARRTRRRRSAK